jgi:hypothetical protein
MIRTTFTSRSLAAAVAALVVAAFGRTAQAQGTVSAQSFGYPPGEMSTRALGTAGAVGEIDARSPINPSALVLQPQGAVFAQYDPELRSVTTQSGTANTTTARFTNVGAVLPVNRRLVLGASATTFLDRTWKTQRSRTQALGPDTTVTSTEVRKSDGGIEDLRFGAGYEVNKRFRVGLAAHGYTGSTRVTASELFTDTLRYRDITQVANLSYTGTAVSAGMEFDVLPKLNVAMSARKGGSATMYVGDTVLAHGNIPDRYSASVSFEGLPGTLVAARYARERWSQMAALSTTGSSAVDASDMSVGLESAGPRIGGFPLLVRLGIRRRDLPFPVNGATVKETQFGGGLGIPVAFDRVTFDIAALRSNRTGVAGVDEHAYNLSFGLRVRP